jgi:hypothetical protein
MYVQTPDEESVAIGFRMPDKNDKEAILADLTSAILYNGKSGSDRQKPCECPKSTGRLWF